MRPGGGSHKGSAWERNCARTLSAWWYPNSKDICYLWRRPGPGSNFYSQPHRFTGDIIPQLDKAPPYPFPFSVEAKFVRDLELSKLLTNPKGSFIYKTWAKAAGEARSDLDVMLLVKENRRPELVFLTVDTYKKLGWDYSGPELLFPYVDYMVLGLPWTAAAVDARRFLNNVERGISNAS